MAQSVCAGATLQCSFGSAPSALVVPVPTVLSEGPPTANINDKIPITNIPPFLLCNSLANPQVAAATAAAAGTLTPMPCLPTIPAPWVPGSPTALVRGAPALNNQSQLQCAFGGVITIVMPQTTRELVP